MLKFSVKADGFDELQEAIARACTKAEHIVAVQVKKDTSPYVPFLTGSLDERTRVSGNRSSIRGRMRAIFTTGKLW